MNEKTAGNTYFQVLAIFATYWEKNVIVNHHCDHCAENGQKSAEQRVINANVCVWI